MGTEKQVLRGQKALKIVFLLPEHTPLNPPWTCLTKLHYSSNKQMSEQEKQPVSVSYGATLSELQNLN